MNFKIILNKITTNPKSGGIILTACTIISLIISNSQISTSYINFWNISFLNHSITHWVNDGLMSIFFLLIGLELQKEIKIGELSNINRALFPIICALGGVVAPTLIFSIFNFGSSQQSGAGIPMATDIAFVIGVLSLLGNKVPSSLKVFLVALAVIDDLCAILVIAFFYTNHISLFYLLIALLIIILLFVLRKKNVYVLWPYMILGVALWYCFLHSGIHATIAGVLLAFTIPFKNIKENNPSEKLEHLLHYPVHFFILPVFALANTCIVFGANWIDGITTNLSLGIITGLLIGKPLGIIAFGRIATAMNICKPPSDLTWKHIYASSILGGIGFTMSIFITMLAFENETFITTSKIAVILASVIAVLLGLFSLEILLKKRIEKH